MVSPSPHPRSIENSEIASALNEAAELLESQAESRFRIAAFQLAARTIARLQRPVQEIFAEQGLAGLRSLPGIGKSIARSIGELLSSGRWGRLERLRRERQRSAELTSLPGVGRKLAKRIGAALGEETLQEVERAAFDGRLRQVPGIGAKRIRAIRDSLAVRLHGGTRRRRSSKAVVEAEPPVTVLLELDREYRRRAAVGRLPQVAPKRFNPTHAAWLPVMQRQRGEQRYRVLYSNTSRAHDAESAPDWVVIYRDDGGSGQWTVVTARFGRLRGRRIVRGREAECHAYYAMQREQLQLDLTPRSENAEASGKS